MIDNIIISIIIPAYNIEEYLAQCLDSILICNPKNIEIIIVNDGSTDGTGEIVNQFASQYSFIKAIHQANQGVSAARNNGLSVAKGDYIWFVDGDDWIPNYQDNVLNQMLNLIAKDVCSDIVFINILYADKKNKIKSDFSENIHYERLDLNFLLSERILMSHPCDKLVKRKLLLVNKVRFTPKLIVAEDYLWNIDLLQYANSYSWLSTICYAYRVGRLDSASTVLTEEKISILINVLYDSVLKISSSESLDNDLKKYLLLFSSAVWFHVMPELYIRKNKNISDLKNKLIKIMDIYNQKLVPLEKYIRGFKVFRCFVRIFGTKIGYVLYAILVYFKRKNNLF